MGVDAVSFTIGCAALVVHMGATVWLGRRWSRTLSPVLMHAASGVILLVATVAGLAVLGNGTGSALPVMPAISMLYGGAVAWLFVFAALYKSVSLSVLIRLAEAPDGCTPAQMIAEQLVLPRFNDRIDLLVAHGLVRRTQDGFTITAAGQERVNQLVRVQRFWGIRNSGLYSAR